MDHALIKEAVQALAIQTVLLRSSSIRADEKLLPPADLDLAMVAQYKSGPTDEFEVSELTDDEGRKVIIIIFRFQTGVRLIDHEAGASSTNKKKVKRRDEPSEAIVRLEISAEFGAHYKLRDGSDLEALKPALAEFGSCNVGFHVWSYWREFVQSSCARMGIPAIPIGMYRLSKTTSTES